MRDKKRIKRICEKLEKLWNEYPDMRLGQLLENFVIDVSNVWYWEDTNTEFNLDEALKSSTSSGLRSIPKRKQ